jgi:hypothetical protein
MTLQEKKIKLKNYIKNKKKFDWNNFDFVCINKMKAQLFTRKEIDYLFDLHKKFILIQRQLCLIIFNIKKYNINSWEWGTSYTFRKYISVCNSCLKKNCVSYANFTFKCFSCQFKFSNESKKVYIT